MTAPKWRDCADPDELAAAVAAGVEVLRMRGGGWVPSALTHRDDFAWFLTHGTRYQLPASWTWRPEPTPEPDDLRERIARAAWEGDGWAIPWVAASAATRSRYLRFADAALAVLPQQADVARLHAALGEQTAQVKRWRNKASTWQYRAKKNKAEADRLAARLDEADAEIGRLDALPQPPVPPWPGAVLSGLCDEDGEPTWLAQAPNVQGEAVRTCVDFPWFICGSDNAVTPYWVEVRAPGARCRAVRGGGCDGTSDGPTRKDEAMNEIPTYTAPEGVNGPTLGIALPDGCERLRGFWDPHTASADRWLANGAAVDEYLYWWRFPPLKVGDRVQLTGTVVVAPKGGWPFVAIDGDHDDERPFPTDALTRVVTP